MAGGAGAYTPLLPRRPAQALNSPHPHTLVHPTNPTSPVPPAVQPHAALPHAALARGPGSGPPLHAASRADLSHGRLRLWPHPNHAGRAALAGGSGSTRVGVGVSVNSEGGPGWRSCWPAPSQCPWPDSGFGSHSSSAPSLLCLAAQHAAAGCYHPQPLQLASFSLHCTASCTEPVSVSPQRLSPHPTPPYSSASPPRPLPTADGPHLATGAVPHRLHAVPGRAR